MKTCCISFLLLCNTLPQAQQLTTDIYYLAVSVSVRLSRALRSGPWAKVQVVACLSSYWRLQVLFQLTDCWQNSALCSCRTTAFCSLRPPAVPRHMALPTTCSHFFEANRKAASAAVSNPSNFLFLLQTSLKDSCDKSSPPKILLTNSMPLES